MRMLIKGFTGPLTSDKAGFRARKAVRDERGSVLQEGDTPKHVCT